LIEGSDAWSENPGSISKTSWEMALSRIRCEREKAMAQRKLTQNASAAQLKASRRVSTASWGADQFTKNKFAAKREARIAANEISALN